MRIANIEGYTSPMLLEMSFLRKRLWIVNLPSGKRFPPVDVINPRATRCKNDTRGKENRK